jgi:hypothetical protein
MTTPATSTTEKPKRRGRGRARTMPERLERAINRGLLGILEGGIPVIDPSTGQVAIGPDGKPLRRPAPATYYAVAIRWMEKLEKLEKMGRPRRDLEESKQRFHEMLAAARARVKAGEIAGRIDIPAVAANAAALRNGSGDAG